MNNGALVAIAALLCTSLLVRVAPAICNLKLPDKFVPLAETIIPTAVFLNFVVYIFMQEMRISFVAATVSLIVTVLLAYLEVGGVIFAIIVGCTAYFLIAGI